MPAPLITDKFGKASISTNYAIATTVKTARIAGVTVLEAYDLSKYAADTPVFVVTYKKTTNPTTGEVTVTNLVSFKALVNTGANTLTNLTVAPGYTDLGNDIGDFVECIPTSYWENSLIEGILTQHKPDGSHSAITADSINAGDASFNTLTVGGVPTANGWNPFSGTMGAVTNNGQKEVTFSVLGADLTGILEKGSKIRGTRPGTVATQCAQFTASSSQYASINTPAGLAQTDNITVMLSFKVDSYPAAGQTMTLAMVGDGVNPANGWAVEMNDNGRVWIIAYNGGNPNSRQVAMRQSVRLGKKYRIAFTLNLGSFTTATNKCVLDGVDVYSDLNTNSAITTIGTGGTRKLVLGSSYGTGKYFDGEIFDFRVYNSILTVQQIRDLTNQFPAANTGMVAWFKTNGNFNDSSSNANNLAAANAANPAKTSAYHRTNEHMIVTKDPVLVGSDTLLTVFGGHDGNIPNLVLTNLVYSNISKPYGWPAAKYKWSVDTWITGSSSSVSITSANTLFTLPFGVMKPAGEFTIKAQGYMEANPGSPGVTSPAYKPGIAKVGAAAFVPGTGQRALDYTTGAIPYVGDSYNGEIPVDESTQAQYTVGIFLEGMGAGGNSFYLATTPGGMLLTAQCEYV